MFKVQKKILSNGLRVLIVPMENSEAVTVLALVNTGSKKESKDINGISHFLEHLFFKGTNKRPNPGDIDDEINKIGADHNAFTGEEKTGFWIKSSSKDTDTCLEIISDLVLNPLFKEEEIEKERGVILQEIGMYEDMPPRKVFDELSAIMYGDQPAGRTILGTRENIKKISRKDILKYRDGNYRAKDMVVIVSGGIKDKKILEKIKKYFGKLKDGSAKKSVKTKISQKSVNVKLIEKEIDQSHLVVGVHAYNMFDDRRYALLLLATILGGNSSSRLYTEIRQKRGLAYYVGSFNSLEVDVGSLVMRAGIAHENLERTAELIKEIISDIKKNGVSDRELADAKSFVRGQTSLELETSDQIASFYGEHELHHKKVIHPDEILKKIEKVTQSDILKVAKDIFKPKNISMAVIGRNKYTEENRTLFKKILSQI